MFQETHQPVDGFFTISVAGMHIQIQVAGPGFPWVAQVMAQFEVSLIYTWKAWKKSIVLRKFASLGKSDVNPM